MKTQSIDYTFEVEDKNTLTVMLNFNVVGEAPKTIYRTWEIREYVEELLLKYEKVESFENGLKIILSGILEVSMYSKLNLTYSINKLVSPNTEGLPNFIMYYEVYGPELLMDIKIEVTRNAN